MNPRVVIPVMFLLVSLCSAQSETRFSSVYTDLNTQCKQQGDPNTAGGNDLPLVCKGYGGYTVRISFSAWAAYLSAEKGQNISVSLAQTELDYDGQKGRKLEWRLANGVPFAVILRVNTYRTPPDGENPFQDKLRTGAVLRVVGLAGFERISGEVNIRQTNANAQARFDTSAPEITFYTVFRNLEKTV